jgi:hypothetical protein
MAVRPACHFFHEHAIRRTRYHVEFRATIVPNYDIYLMPDSYAVKSIRGLSSICRPRATSIGAAATSS